MKKYKWYVILSALILGSCTFLLIGSYTPLIESCGKEQINSIFLRQLVFAIPVTIVVILISIWGTTKKK